MNNNKLIGTILTFTGIGTIVVGILLSVVLHFPPMYLYLLCGIGAVDLVIAFFMLNSDGRK